MGTEIRSGYITSLYIDQNIDSYFISLDNNPRLFQVTGQQLSQRGWL